MNKVTIDFLSEIQRAINYKEMAYVQRTEFSKDHICLCLHQSIEFIFKSISKYLKRYVIKTHSLLVLNESIRESAPQIYNVFSEEKHLLISLDKLYANAPLTKNKYLLSNENMSILFEKVTKLQDVCINLVNVQ